MEKEIAILNLEIDHFNPDKDNVDIKVESINGKLKIKVFLIEKPIPTAIKATKLKLSLD